MLNPEKTELNSRLLVFEQGEGRVPIKLKNDRGSTGRRHFLAANVFCAVFGYLCIAALVFIAVGYTPDHFADNIAATVLIVSAVLLAGSAFVVGYLRAVDHFTGRQYRDTRASLVRYELTKRRLNRLNKT